MNTGMINMNTDKPVEKPEEAVDRLKTLSAIEYEICRVEEAKRLAEKAENQQHLTAKLEDSF